MAVLSQWIQDWCAEVKQATGVTPMIYTTRWYANHCFNASLSQYPFWVPTYSSTDTPPNSTPSNLMPWSTWTFQQYAADPTTQGGGVGGICPGINGYALLDSFNGSLSELQALANQTVNYTITLNASPSVGGTVSGSGTYSSGSSRTVTATANSGYTFSSWTESGSVVSTSSSYTFTLTGNRTLVANFTQNAANYTITLSASPSTGGAVSGSGTFTSGSSKTVAATANSGYTFANWTENGNVVSTSSSYTFTLTGNRTLVAHFMQNTANDNFSSRTVISANGGTLTGTNTGASKETGEPNHADYTGGKSVWWTWTPIYSGSTQIDTIGSGFDTLLGIYTGSSVSTLATVASDDDSGGNRTSKATFNAVAGTTYQIAVDGYAGASGTITLHVIAPLANPALNVSTTLLTLPATIQGTAGATASFTVSGSGLGSGDSLTLTAPTGCEISQNSLSGFVSTFVL
jgi:hypothetical protein